MTKAIQKQEPLSIELLPEFGQLMNGQPVYGPGSVFQGPPQRFDLPLFYFTHLFFSFLLFFFLGVVHLSLPSTKHTAQRLLLVFHATETVQLHSTMTSVIRGRHQQLFGTQLTLWETPAEEASTDPKGQYPFTLQMPMLQYPPSLDYGRLRYRCRFKLTAILENSRRSSPLLTAHQTVYYRPWIPTRTLKVPVIRHSKELVVQMAQSDIVAGELCQLQVSSSSSVVKVVMELVQIVTLPFQMNDERVPPSETVVARSAPIVVVPSQKQMPLSMAIPAATPPTYCSGRVIALRYELSLQVCLMKKRKRVPWPGSCFGEESEVRLPLVIGTLGHGIRIPEDMTHYTDFDGFSDTSPVNAVPVPKFLPSIEYQNSPPRYLPSSLPPYPADNCT